MIEKEINLEMRETKLKHEETKLKRRERNCARKDQKNKETKRDLVTSNNQLRKLQLKMKDQERTVINNFRASNNKYSFRKL